MADFNSLDTKKALEFYGFPPVKSGGGSEIFMCPIHGDGTKPSFHVYPDGHWHCYGKCNTGGNVIKFIMDYKGIPFVLAVKEAEKIYGIKFEFDRTREKYAPLFKANRELSALYEQELAKRADVLKYLKGRGLTDESIKYWGIGFALADHVMQDSEKYDLYARSGAMSIADRQYFATFNQRITFPIRDVNGEIVGFSARINPLLPKDFMANAAKYKNSPTTEIFDKKRTIFGLGSRFNELVKQHKFIMLTEGAMDAVVPQQEGVPSVALMGLGSNDLSGLDFLTKYSTTLVFCYDGDDAGYTRALTLSVKGIFPYLEEHPKVKIKMAFLPEGFDPDEYVIKYSADNLIDIVKNAPTAEQYVVDKIIADAMKIEDYAERRAWLFENHEKSMLALPKYTRRAYLRRIEKELDMDILAFLNETPVSSNTPVSRPVVQQDDDFVPPPADMDEGGEVPMDADDDFPQEVKPVKKAPAKPKQNDITAKLFDGLQILKTIKSNPEYLEVANQWLTENGLQKLSAIEVKVPAVDIAHTPADKYWSDESRRRRFVMEYRAMIAKLHTLTLNTKSTVYTPEWFTDVHKKIDAMSRSVLEIK